MEAAILGTCIPFGYILCGLLTARATLAHLVRPDGTYDPNDEAGLMATTAAIFWPAWILGYAIHRLFKGGWGVSWIIDPKPVRDRKRREREQAAKRVSDMIDATLRAERARARTAAQENDLPWPTQNPFIDDTGAVNYNPVGRPPMSEGK